MQAFFHPSQGLFHTRASLPRRRWRRGVFSPRRNRRFGPRTVTRPRRGYGYRYPSPNPSRVLVRLAVPVVDPLRPEDHADATQVDLVRTRVVGNVVRVTRPVGEHRQPALTTSKRMRHPRGRWPGDDVTAPDRVLVLPEQADAVAVQDHEHLLLERVAVRRTAQLAGLDPVVVDARGDRTGSDAQVSALDADVALPPWFGVDLVHVDNPHRPRARR